MFDPPAWSLALGAAGRILILVAAGFFAVTGISWLLATKTKALELVGKLSFTAACASLMGAFVSLGILFANNRYEFEYIYGHSDNKNALAYRIAGIWSGQEGSFLLWATCAAVFGLFTVAKTGHLRRWYTISYAFFLGGIASILAFESPFNHSLVEGRIFVPDDGLGLAPSLQNYWVIIHPPVIFLGFASLTSLFALAVAAMIEKDYEGWVPIVRPWAIIATSLVGVGLCMGGFWAYETLGWGGFWMWDPVENVSFVPWCFAAALVHGLIVQTTKKKWLMSNLLMGGLPFLIFVYGTYLTRSGLLSDASVHSFAEMNRSALMLLLTVMGVSTLGFLGLWAWRTFEYKKTVKDPDVQAKAFSKDGFYMVGITLLLVMGAATAIGMSVPLFQALAGQKPRVVEEAVYHQVLAWIFVPTMLIMAAAPFVSWKGMTFKELFGRIYTILCITVGLTGLFLFLIVITPFGRNLDLAPVVTMLGKYPTNGLAWITFLGGICLFVVVSNLWCAAEIVKRSKVGTMPFITHIGVGVLMAGLILSRGLQHKGQTMVMEDSPGRLLNYEVRYAGMTHNETDRDNQLKLDIYTPASGSKPLFTARPGLYKLTMADGQESVMVWPHVERGLLMDTYVSLGTPQENASQEFSLKPGATTQVGQMMFTYKKMTRKGQPGEAGTRFGAEVEVAAGGQTMLVNPELEIGGGQGPTFHPVPIADKMELVMVSMNAADKSVSFKVQVKIPIYPVEIYHKPFTSLVWLGTGVMTLGGIGAAIYRRPRKATPNSQATEKEGASA